jgi:metallo-beta-lactamase family protein
MIRGGLIMVKITCLGAAGTVTGSNYLIEAGNKKYLVDCGMFQGGVDMELRNWLEWNFDPQEIDALILTHAHIDHSGRIPKLVKDGFKGRIIATPATVELCEVMLLDSAHVQEMDAEWQNRKNSRKGKKPVEPLYTIEEAEACSRYFVRTDRERIIQLDDTTRLRFRNAGHILGSCIAEMWVKDDGKELKVVFSGDIGQKHQIIMAEPQELYSADYLFVESTYGNRLHRSIDASKDELLDAVKYAYNHGEKVIIPAFAVERTQEILYILSELNRSGKLPDIPVFLDSPLAIKATNIFRKFKKEYDEEALAIVSQGIDPFDMPNLRFTNEMKESMAINTMKGPAIVIAGNGMCTAGRIKHHLKHNLWKPGASIVIVGFQAQGTTGRMLVEGRRSVRVLRENISVRARIFSINGFSSHADQKGLMEWIGHFKPSSPQVFVVHGEQTASETLAKLIREELKLDAQVPEWREKLLFRSGEATKEIMPKEVYAPADISPVMMKAISSVEVELERLKAVAAEAASAGRITPDDIDKLKAIREDMEAILA